MLGFVLLFALSCGLCLHNHSKYEPTWYAYCIPIAQSAFTALYGLVPVLDLYQKYSRLRASVLERSGPQQPQQEAICCQLTSRKINQYRNSVSVNNFLFLLSFNLLIIQVAQLIIRGLVLLLPLSFKYNPQVYIGRDILLF